MISIKRIIDEEILICSFDGNWTQEMYRQALRQMEKLAGTTPQNIIADLSQSRLTPTNLMELTRDAVQRARRAQSSVVVVSRSSLFQHVYEIVCTAYFAGQESPFVFVKSLEEALNLLREKVRSCPGL